MEEVGTTTVQLMDITGMSRNTFYKRLKNPREFTVGNLEDMSKLWRISVSKLTGKPVMAADEPLVVQM